MEETVTDPMTGEEYIETRYVTETKVKEGKVVGFSFENLNEIFLPQLKYLKHCQL